MDILRLLAALAGAFLLGRLMTKIHMPAILGWLIGGMALGPHAINLLPKTILDSSWYSILNEVLQVAVGLMLGTELVWKKLRKYGRALMITTLTQSLGTFLIVSAAFAAIFLNQGIPVWLAFAFGGIALATAPAPALSITQEYHTSGPVTNTLLPMAVLDDIVGIIVFFTVNSFIARQVSAGTMPLYMVPVMIFFPILIGIIPGYITGTLLRSTTSSRAMLTTILTMICLTASLGHFCNIYITPTISLNYVLIGVSFSAVFSNMVSNKQLETIEQRYNPFLMISLLFTIVTLGAPLDYHLIAGAGTYTFLYIAARAIGKYFGARFGAKATRLPVTVQKYLGLTLLPHSGVSLVFTGIICTTLASQPQLVQIVQGTIAAAAIINEFIAVIAARKGFELAGEIPSQAQQEATTIPANKTI
ncbi:MAG: cation:proton antiporter [Galactobacillus timonensis]|uniref:cation:proton antiporter n=1 Tax=Galactobacillus timonensis TaxID=2041840 RepID=UPI0023F1E86E|nr:cation:proton antiporter [Galactobacillus timonensis]MCI6067871.1 cation:proton antiporter [Galactobacillus timonensis]